MSTLLWPGITSDEKLTRDAIEDTLARELDWFLDSLQETLRSLKNGLDECATLLAPKDPGATLVLSSHRSEALKGYVTRVGNRIVKGDVQIRLPSLPAQRGQQAFRASISQKHSASDITLDQLVTTRTLINSCLDVVDATQWTGDAKNANFISGQLRLLHDNVQEARAALRGIDMQMLWTEASIDSSSFDPPLPHNLSFHLSISEAALVLSIRTLEMAYPHSGTNTPLSSSATNTYSGFSLRERLASALVGGNRPSAHDEIDQVFHYRGQDVKVRDKVRVESQDPSLMAALAKLGALERSVNISRRALAVVMSQDMDG